MFEQIPILNRERGDFPIDGPSWFVEKVNAVLTLLETKAPGRLQEVITFLPSATYSPASSPLNAWGSSWSEGVFTCGPEHDEHTILETMLYAVGVNMQLTRVDEYQEQAVQDYVNMVALEVA